LLILAIFYSLRRFFRWVARTLTSFFSTRVGPPITRFLDRTEESYKRALTKLLDKSGMVVICAIILFLITLPIFNFLGGEFFPQVDDNSSILDVQLEPWFSLFELAGYISHLESIF